MSLIHTRLANKEIIHVDPFQVYTDGMGKNGVEIVGMKTAAVQILLKNTCYDQELLIIIQGLQSPDHMWHIPS